jgi:uncharacterized protein YjiS (DUF1127 family)
MLVTYILSSIRRYMRNRETIRELSEMSDRQLDDLGIARGQIARVVRNASIA